MQSISSFFFFFFFNDTATTEIYTLSLHDALPIELGAVRRVEASEVAVEVGGVDEPRLELRHRREQRSEEHTSELQSRQYLVCRLLLEKKKKKKNKNKKSKNTKNNK